MRLLVSQQVLLGHECLAAYGADVRAPLIDRLVVELVTPRVRRVAETLAAAATEVHVVAAALVHVEHVTAQRLSLLEDLGALVTFEVTQAVHACVVVPERIVVAIAETPKYKIMMINGRTSSGTSLCSNLHALQLKKLK